jgi:hypothetical protein
LDTPIQALEQPQNFVSHPCEKRTEKGFSNGGFCLTLRREYSIKH